MKDLIKCLEILLKDKQVHFRTNESMYDILSSRDLSEEEIDNIEIELVKLYPDNIYIGRIKKILDMTDTDICLQIELSEKIEIGDTSYIIFINISIYNIINLEDNISEEE